MMHNKPRTGLVLVLVLLLGSFTHAMAAGLEAFDFTGNVDEERYKQLIIQLRCLVCQNQSLADSDAGLAHDLRREVWELMDSGKSDQEVVDYLVARYGDFVLYNPPVKPSTYILWYGPFVLLVVGALLLWRILRQRQAQTKPEFSAAERERLQQILGNKDSDGK